MVDSRESNVSQCRVELRRVMTELVGAADEEMPRESGISQRGNASDATIQADVFGRNHVLSILFLAQSFDRPPLSDEREVFDGY